MRYVLIMVLLLMYAIPSVAEDCGHQEFIRDFLKYSELKLSGYYLHPDHCFSVIIPEGVIGRYSSQPSSHHGFGAVLPNERGTDYLSVLGDWGAILDNPQDTLGSLSQLVSLRLKWIEEKNALILRKEVTDTILDSLKAKHLVVQYKCNKTGVVFLEDSIIAIESRGLVYEICLYASPQTYKESLSIRDKIVETWKLEKKCLRDNFKKY